MKTNKAERLERPREPQNDPNPISKLEALLDRLETGEKELKEHVKEAHEIYVFSERFCRERRVAFEPDKTADTLLNSRRRVRIFVNDTATLQASIDALKEANASVEKVGKEVDETRAELREFLTREASARNGRIMEEYEKLIAGIVQEILPVCDDKEEALIVAKGLNQPSRFHSQLFVSRGASDDMLGSHARNFLNSLKANVELASGIPK